MKRIYSSVCHCQQWGELDNSVLNDINQRQDDKDKYYDVPICI